MVNNNVKIFNVRCPMVKFQFSIFNLQFFLRPGQGENFCRPETNISLPCASFPSLLSTLQRYEIFIAVYEYSARIYLNFCFKFQDSSFNLTLHCYSVTVLERHFHIPKNTSIFIYKYRVYFCLSINQFWNCNTVTLKHRSPWPCAKGFFYNL